VDEKSRMFVERNEGGDGVREGDFPLSMEELGGASSRVADK
jgi:hypothetical protein